MHQGLCQTQLCPTLLLSWVGPTGSHLGWGSGQGWAKTMLPKALGLWQIPPRLAWSEVGLLTEASRLSLPCGSRHMGGTWLMDTLLSLASSVCPGLCRRGHPRGLELLPHGAWLSGSWRKG